MTQIAPTDVHLLADDLSGALDSAVFFAPGLEGARASVSVGKPREYDLAGNLGSRDLNIDCAIQRLTDAIPWLFDSRWPFLKIDSRLRGHVAASVERLSHFGMPIVIIPAIPSQGRVIQDGRVLSRDAGISWRKEPLDLQSELGRLGASVKLLRPGEAVPDGISLWDTSFDSDLDHIVAAVLASEKRALFCGSSGLAAALARAFKIGPPPIEQVSAPLLMVVGTAHPRTVLQVAEFEKAFPKRHFVVAESESFPALIDQPMLVSAKIPQGSSKSKITEYVDTLLRKIAVSERPGALFVTGGATLETLCRHLNVKSISLTGQFRPGIPSGYLQDGRWAGVSVFCKSGGFSEPDTLTALVMAQVNHK